uniref:KRAB domain-containing protein n=1 Tax=Monodelphis domestica TaxID=13616 RepID=A0A5F8H8Q5_MONDO
MPLKCLPFLKRNVAVSLTLEERVQLDLHQKDLYRNVMLENYENSVLLGLSFPKPAIISHMEQRKDLWLLDIPGAEKRESWENSSPGVWERLPIRES